MPGSRFSKAMWTRRKAANDLSCISAVSPAPSVWTLSGISRVQPLMTEKLTTQILFVMGAVTLATFGVLVESYTYLF